VYELEAGIMSSEKFEFAQDEMDGQLEKLAASIKLIEKADNGQARKRHQQVCEKCVEDGEKLVDEMETEARSAPLQFRAEMLASVRSYRSRLDMLRSSLRSTQRLSSTSGTLAGGGGGGRSRPGDAYREKVIAGVSSLDRTGESIQRAQQISAETDEVGIGIIDDLETQRESLERTRTRLIDTDTQITSSRNILKKMYLNVRANKIILICIIFIELGILIGLVYWKFIAKASS